MARNIEVKVKCDSRLHQRTLELAEYWQAEMQPEFKQTDTCFNTSDGRLLLREYENDSAPEMISYEREDLCEPRVTNYLRYEVDRPDEVKRLLGKTAGIRCVVNKTRRKIKVDQAEIHLDQVDGLGEFLEIVVALRKDQINDVGFEIMESLVEQLQIDPQDLESASYADLLMKLKASE